MDIDYHTDSSDDQIEDTQIAPSTSKKCYDHKYNYMWEKQEQFKKWIAKSTKGELYFHCKSCNQDLKGGLSAVRKHNISKKHITAVSNVKVTSVFNMKSVIQSKNSAKNIKTAEVRIAAFIAEHNIPINSTDHLVTLIKSIKLDANELKKLTCDRTKCTSIINNVIGKSGFELLIESLKLNSFSLLIDESTDLSTIKHLALVVRTCIDFKVTDSFICLLPLSDGSAKNIYSVIVEFFTSNDVPFIKNCIGFAADGCNVMQGSKNSVQALFRKDIPNIFIMKCICHSLALCAEYACRKLPDDIEILIRNIYNYVQHSFKRQQELKEIQQLFNLKFHKMLQLSSTRWLSLLAVVKRINEQYPALKAYFNAQTFDNIEKSYNITNGLNNPINKLYLDFLEFILPTLNDLNLEFQSELPKIYLLYDRMANAYKFIIIYYSIFT